MAQRTNTAAHAAQAVVPSVQQPIHTVVECGYAAWHRAFMAQVAMYLPATRKALKGQTTHLTVEEKVIFKAMRLVCRRAGSRDAIKPRTPRNSPEVRAAITARDQGRSVEKVTMHHEAQVQGISIATMLARKAQGSAQKALNAVRVLARMVDNKPSKVSPTKAYMVRTTDTPMLGKLVGAHSSDARYKSTHVVHATYGAKVADARGEFKTLASAKKAAKAALVIEQAAKWAARKEAYRMRKEAMAVIAADAWMMKGVWLPQSIVEAANDWSYAVRIAAFKEARNIAYGVAALVGVAA